MTLLAAFAPLFAFGQEEAEVVAEAAPLELNLTFADVSIAIAAIIALIIAIVSIYKVGELLIRMRKLEIYEKHGLDKFLKEN